MNVKALFCNAVGFTSSDMQYAMSYLGLTYPLRKFEELIFLKAYHLTISLHYVSTMVVRAFGRYSVILTLLPFFK